MNIRAVTGFVDPGWPLKSDRLAEISICMKTARVTLQEIGYEVQSLRLATPPPSEMEN
jgi:hypothetical protein